MAEVLIAPNTTADIGNLSESSTYFTKPIHWIVTLFFTPVCLLAVVVNITVLATIRTLKAIHVAATRRFITSLAATDLLLALTLGPTKFAILLFGGRLSNLCPLVQLPLNIVQAASLGNVILVSVDRYVAVSRPLAYILIMSRTRVLLSITACWMASTISQVVLVGSSIASGLQTECGDGDIVFPYPPWLVVFFVVFVGVTSVVVMVTSVSVGKTAWNRLHDTPSLILGALDQKAEEKHTLQQELQIVKLVSMVIAAYVVVFFPFVILHAVLTFGDESDRWLVVPLLKGFGFLTLCKTLLNPVIYCWSNRDFKVAYKRLMRMGRREVHGEVAIDMAAT